VGAENREDAMTEGTPPARWRVEKARGSFGFWRILRRPDNRAVAVIRGRMLFDADCVDMVAALNETEALRERLRLAEADRETYRTSLLTLSFCPECDAEPEGPADHKPDCRVGLAEERRLGITRTGAGAAPQEGE